MSDDEIIKKIHSVACEFYDVQFIRKLEAIFENLKEEAETNDKLKDKIINEMLIKDHDLYELQKMILLAKKHGELKALFETMDEEKLCAFVKARYERLKGEEKRE